MNILESKLINRRHFLTGAAAFGAFGGARAFAAPCGSCDGGNPRLIFAALSDIHVQVTTGDHIWGGGTEIFEKAMRWYASQGVDAVLIAGDLADLGLGDELMYVAKAWYRVFPNDRAADGRKVERLFITGNHEYGVWLWNNNLKRIRKLYNNDDAEVKRQLLRYTVAEWWQKAFDEKYERFYHRRVKGYDFLNANWDDGMPMPDLSLDECVGKSKYIGETFGVDLKAWLDAHGRELDPSKPFFYQQHRSLWKTTYADWAWNHDRGLATSALSAYPNAVSFAGDTHYSLTDERSIWQGAFTALGTASLRYPGDPYDSRRDGIAYENTSGGNCAIKTMPCLRPSEGRQGMLITVYDDRMVIKRRDFTDDCPLGDDWVVPFGHEERPFAFAPRSKKATAPAFAVGAKLTVTNQKAKTRGSAKEPATEKDCICISIPSPVQTAKTRCFEYEVTAFGENGAKATFRVMAEGYYRPAASKAAKASTNCVVSRDRLPAGTNRIEVRALDSWWNRSAPITVVV